MTCQRRLAVAAVALCLLAGAARAADVPPSDLHLVGDHWTAWDPPTEHPPGAQVYIIVPGDTLWALAGRFYENPYLWPQLWERNQYIKDAHWIYPGDPLVISLEVAPVEDLAEEDLGGGAAGEGGAMAEDRPDLRLDPGVAPPEPLGAEDDIYCSGYIGDPDEEFGYRIVGSEYSALSPTLYGTSGDRRQINEGRGVLGEQDTVKFDLSVGDIVYIDGGFAAGLAPGLVYVSVTPGGLIEHPISREVVGRLYEYKGRVRVLTVQENAAIGEIVHACDPLHVGDILKPFVPEPVPLGRRTRLRPANAPVAASELEDDAVILHGKEGRISLGADHVVYIDRGADQGLAPGDVFTVYRSNRNGLPPVVLGELAVLSVHDRSSVARIIESRYTIFVGDRLEPK
jgi:hypothetical protein